MDLVSKLVKAFPNGGANAGGGYLGALAATLVTYPRMVATKCCDPVQGVSRETRFLPTVADLVAFCERETEAMRKPVEREDIDAKILREMADRRAEGEYWAKLRPTRASLAELRERHGPNWGLQQSDDLAAKRVQATTIQKANERAWARAGGTVSAGIVITSALVKTVDALKARALAGTEG